MPVGESIAIVADFQAVGFIGILDEGVGERPHVTFSFINLGNSPAFVVEYSVRVRYFENGVPQKPDYGDPFKVPEGCRDGAEHHQYSAKTEFGKNADNDSRQSHCAQTGQG